MTPRRPISRLSLWLTMLAVVAAGACGEQSADKRLRPAPRPKAPLASAPTGGIGAVPLDGAAVTRARKRLTVLAQNDDDEIRDYWAPIPFDRSNFEEVRSFVRERYIERDIDEGRSYAEAAAFALASDAEHPLLLLPKGFYDARKDHPDEEGLLSGKAHTIRKGDGYVVVEAVEPKEEKKRRRLSDDEIRELRAQDRARRALLDKSWTKAGFKAADFDRTMSYAARTLGKDKKWTTKKAWVAAAQGYLYSLDPHSALIAKEAWEDSTKELTDASFEGIGAILTRRPDSDYTIVESPIDGQPAVKAGLRAGDMILMVDGRDIKGMLLPKVVSRIKGPKGTQVILTVSREGEPDPLDIAITRSRIDIKNIQGRLVNEHSGIGYIKITGFVPTTNGELGRVYDELSARAPGGRLKGMILDLRRNSGGLLRQGIKVADRFLSDGNIVTVRNRGEPDEVHKATRRGTWDVPLTVLVNDGSASASEIVASALQDSGRALLVGDRTFGKASVQTLFSPLLRDEYYIKLTVARYYSPSGRTLQVLGVSPDVFTPPEVGKPMPLGFREANLSHHLSAIDAVNKTYTSVNAPWAKEMTACADRSGVAEKIYKKDLHPALKFDYQLMRAADLLVCMRTEGAETSAAFVR